MESKLFSIRDSKAGVYNQPFHCHTPGEAERHFQRLVRDPQSMISMFPDDYDLYFIGIFDDERGVVATLETPQHIVKGTQLKERDQSARPN